MGAVTNVPPRSLEERIKAVTTVAKQRNLDLELFFNCTSGCWGSNCNDSIRQDLGDLLDLIEEDVRDFGIAKASDDDSEHFAESKENKYQPWKP